MQPASLHLNEKSAERWAKAQEYEKTYWRGVAARIAKGAGDQLTWYRDNAERCRRLILPHLRKDPSKIGKVVEVGSGPIGISTFFGLGQRYATDPLEDFYGSNPELSTLRSSDVTYLKVPGERLPFDDRSVDVVIIENVLDHTQRPDLVLKEIHRILADDGVLFFKVNIRTQSGTAIHRVLSKTNIDTGHPHSYSHQSVRRTLERHGLTIRYEQVDDYRKARRFDLNSKRLKDRLKAMLGISEFWYTAICHKSQGARTP